MPDNEAIQAQLVTARRNQILDAATEVFADKGFHRATIKDIAKKAGIADGTIYIYFENKTALLMGILDRLNATAERQSDFEQAAPSFESWFTAYFKQRLEHMGPQALQVFQVIFSEVLVNQDLREEYFQQIVQPTFNLADGFFKQWAEEGLVKDLPSTLVNRAMAGMTLGLLMLRVMGDPELEAHWDDVPSVVTEMVMRGLLKGEQRGDQNGDHS